MVPRASLALAHNRLLVSRSHDTHHEEGAVALAVWDERALGRLCLCRRPWWRRQPPPLPTGAGAAAAAGPVLSCGCYHERAGGPARPVARRPGRSAAGGGRRSAARAAGLTAAGYPCCMRAGMHSCRHGVVLTAARPPGQRPGLAALQNALGALRGACSDAIPPMAAVKAGERQPGSLVAIGPQGAHHRAQAADPRACGPPGAPSSQLPSPRAATPARQKWPAPLSASPAGPPPSSGSAPPAVSCARRSSSSSGPPCWRRCGQQARARPPPLRPPSCWFPARPARS